MDCCKLNSIQKVYFTSDLLILISSGILIVYEIILYISTLNYTNNGYIKDILSNWEFKPIIDLKVLDEEPSDEYSDNLNQFSFMSWDGTIEGCNCLNATKEQVGEKYSNKIHRFSCKSDDFKKYCETILSTNGRNINIWKGKKIIPVFNYNSKRYFDYLSKSNLCDSDDYKLCGILDNKLNKMCVLKEEKCPINKMIIDKKESAPKDYKYITLKLNNDYYLHYTNEANDAKILVSFRVSEGQICVDSNKHYSRNPDYQLYSTFEYGGNCDSFDNRYFRIDSENKINLFDENGITNLTKNLPNFTIVNEEIFLYYRNYIGLSKDKNINIEDADSIKRFMEVYNSLKAPKLFVNLLIISFSLFELIKNCYKTYSKYIITNTDIIIKFVLIILNILFLLMSILLIIIEGNSVTILNNLDQTSYTATKSLKLEIIFSKTFFILSIILSSANIVLCIFWFCGRNLYYCFQDESNKDYENFENRGSLPSGIIGKSGRTTYQSLYGKENISNFKIRETEHIKEEENEDDIKDNEENGI